MGSLGRTSLLWLLAAAACVSVEACADTNNLTGGEDTVDAGSLTKPKDDSGSSPIDPEGGGPTTPTGRCDPLKPFGAPELVSEFDPQATTSKSAVLSPDELEAFYLRYNGTPSGSWDLRHARRATRDAAWNPVVTDPLAPGAQGFLSLTAAAKKLYFWTIGQNYRTVRASTSDPFGPPTTYSSPEAPYTFIVQSDDTAYFGKLAEGGTERFIHRASFDNFGFNTSKPVPNVHVTGATDSRPVLNATETAMYFGSNRPGGRGLDDVWVARRATKQEEFGPAVHVRELSTDDPDYVTWVSDDDCIVMLDRASHIYEAKRPL